MNLQMTKMNKLPLKIGSDVSKSDQLSHLTATITTADRVVLDETFKDMETDPERNGMAVLLR